MINDNNQNTYSIENENVTILSNNNNNTSKEESRKIDQGISLRRSLLLIGIYVSVFYIFGSFISLIISGIFSLFKIEVSHEALMYAIINFSTYFILALSLIPFCIKIFITDFHKFKNHLTKNILIIIISTIVLLTSTIIVSLLIYLLLFILNKIGIVGNKYIELDSTSENQQLITEMLTSSIPSAILTIIPTVILAPILEELVFRKALFGLNQKIPALGIIISSIIFASIHVVSGIFSNSILFLAGKETFDAIIVECIYFFSYFTDAVVLSLAYYLSNYNIYVTILIHLINNLISVVETLALIAIII